jgi:hypothetical protein
MQRIKRAARWGRGRLLADQRDAGEDDESQGENSERTSGRE